MSSTYFANKTSNQSTAIVHGLRNVSSTAKATALYNIDGKKVSLSNIRANERCKSTDNVCKNKTVFVRNNQPGSTSYDSFVIDNQLKPSTTNIPPGL
jgi:membrane-bound inhibitor of C-type lysozyme